MNRLPRLPSILLLIAATGFMAVATRAQDAAVPSEVIEAYTEPSKRLKMAFSTLGVIREVSVKEGDAVKAGQLLVAQDAEVEALELERLEAEAESKARIEAAEADLAVKRKTYERKRDAPEGTYNDAEIEEAKLDVTFREKQLEIARMDQGQNVLKARQQAARVDRMELKSKIDGLVEKIDIWEGEMADPSKPAVIVVKNDPLYIMVQQLKTHQVAQLRLGDTLQVRYPGENSWQEARISFISPVAAAGANTQSVRLEMPNSANRATGLPIQVKLPEKLNDQRGGDKAALNR